MDSSHLSRCKPVYVSPDGTEEVFPTLNLKKNQFSRVPDTDYILVSLDFHHLCVTRPCTEPDRTLCRQNTITEAGIAYLDMRDVLYDRGKDLMPGDRGLSWFKLMTPLHYIVEEYQDHASLPDRSPYLFAFGRSRIVKEEDLSYRLYRVFASLRKKNRRVDEIEHGWLRQIIFLSFDSAPVETALKELGLEWLAEPNVQIWDLQKDTQLQTHLQQPTTCLEYVLERLGIRFEDTRFGNLSHCTGNSAVFVVQMALALSYKDDEQKVVFEVRKPMDWLRYTWVGHSLDQMNVAPGEVPTRRDEGQMNRHDVPQKRNEHAFG